VLLTLQNTLEAHQEETSGFATAFEQANEEMKAAAEEERARKMEEQKERAYEDAAGDADLYQHYYDQIAERITMLEAMVADGDESQ